MNVERVSAGDHRAFEEPGRYEVVWDLGTLRSNMLTIDVLEREKGEA
jgi:hypothetical protein